MAPELSRQNPEAELQAAFRRHLPQRLRTLLRRARAQCRTGWDLNVLHALHDELGLLAGACGRYGLLETGERLLALEATLGAPLAAHRIPDAAASEAISHLLDSLRPHVEQSVPLQASATWPQDAAAAVAQAPFPRCEVPPADYWLQLGIAPIADASAVATNDAEAAGAPGAVAATPADAPHAPAVCIVNDDDALIGELLLRFDQLKREVLLVERVDELAAQLDRAPPELAILVADAGTAFEHLTTSLQAARANPQRPVHLLALLRGHDAELQLRALRAGADRCIALPATADAALAAALELSKADHDSAYRILIVDDDAPQALFAQAILRRAGMETKILSESLAVLDELDRFKPDLLLLDLNMPDCDGFELTALIREREGYVNTPIVFLSGDQDEERQFAALDAGGDDFLVKPIRPTHLVSAVTNRVRRTRMAAARARARHQQPVGGGLHARSQVLDAVAEHLAVGAGRNGRGGLLAVEVADAASLRQRLGADATDAVLAQVGAFITSHAQSSGMVTRHGDAGFMVFAPARDELALMALAGELMETAQDTRFGAQAVAVKLTCAVCAFDAATAESALALAAVERTLAVARQQPEQLAVHSRLAADADAMNQRLAAALAAHAFGLAFQPVIPLHGAAEPQYQALLRLRTGGREYVAAELVPAATRAGSIAAIDEWVVQRCIDILAERAREGDPVHLFASQSLPGWRAIERPTALKAALDAARVPAGSLVLEFRAADVHGNMRALVDLAPELRRADARLAVAGVDNAALAAGWLEHLPLDYIKLAPGLDDAALAAAVHAAHSRSMKVVAPCVESRGEVTRLRGAGVDLLQGNYFRPPTAELGADISNAEI